MGEWGASTKEYKLVEFQQRVWAKVPPEDEEGLSMKPKSVRQRKWRAKLKEKRDYEDYIKQIKEQAKNK